MPGEQALVKKRQAALTGVPLGHGVMASLEPAALAAGLECPEAIQGY
jgi:hypothetical protein